MYCAECVTVFPGEKKKICAHNAAHWKESHDLNCRMVAENLSSMVTELFSQNHLRTIFVLIILVPTHM